MIKSTTSLIGVYDPLPSHVFHRYYKFLGRGWHASFELPARFTRGYKHPRLFQSGGPGFWAGLGSLMRSRLIPKERPKSSGWGGGARWYPWKCTSARNRKPYEMRRVVKRFGIAGFTEAALPLQRSFPSSSSSSVSFSSQTKSRHRCNDCWSNSIDFYPCRCFIIFQDDDFNPSYLTKLEFWSIRMVPSLV